MSPSPPSDVVVAGAVPRHVVIVMDGNGRWAQRRGLPRAAGHKAGVPPVRAAVQHCVQRGVEVLTLFAFSSENFRRPPQEVGLLMKLFLDALGREVAELGEQGVRLRFIGDRSALAPEIIAAMEKAEQGTVDNTRLQLVIAVAYGGQWDIASAARRLAAGAVAGTLVPADIGPAAVTRELELGRLGLPDVDLFIRTGGERRISNFLLWNLAYAELWFTDVAWPDFDEQALDMALADFAGRQRRHGRTGAQVETESC